MSKFKTFLIVFLSVMFLSISAVGCDMLQSGGLPLQVEIPKLLTGKKIGKVTGNVPIHLLKMNP